MILFSKEKELILKILNGVLLVWFLGAIVFTLNNGINLLVDEPSIEDKIETCKMQCVEEEEGKDCGCDSMYYYDDSEHYELKSLYYSIANVIVVGPALYFLNKKKSTKK